VSTFGFASVDTVGGVVSQANPAVVNNSSARTQHEVVVVALGRTVADLDRLDHLDRSLVARKHVGDEDARLPLFSASGFDSNLRREGPGSGDVELIDLDRVYLGV